jgi:hypothetical protein
MAVVIVKLRLINGEKYGSRQHGDNARSARSIPINREIDLGEQSRGSTAPSGPRASEHGPGLRGAVPVKPGSLGPIESNETGYVRFPT